MASVLATGIAQDVVSANTDNPKVAKTRELEIETGEGLFYLFFAGVKGVGKTAIITQVSCSSTTHEKYQLALTLSRLNTTY
jgi:signal recognition particle GTPase